MVLSGSLLVPSWFALGSLLVPGTCGPGTCVRVTCGPGACVPGTCVPGTCVPGTCGGSRLVASRLFPSKTAPARVVRTTVAGAVLERGGEDCNRDSHPERVQLLVPS